MSGDSVPNGGEYPNLEFFQGYGRSKLSPFGSQLMAEERPWCSEFERPFKGKQTLETLSSASANDPNLTFIVNGQILI